MIKYFKKLVPNTPVRLKDGSSVKFSTLDTLVGYFATDNLMAQESFAESMARNRDAITEISETEFHEDYVKKKPNSKPLAPQWREEIGAGAIRNTTLLAQLGREHIERVNRAADEAPTVVNGSVNVPSTAVEQPAPVPVKTNEYKPNVGKRKKKPNV